MNTVLDREEYVEQAYLFRTFIERSADNLPAQEILHVVQDELLTVTRLPYAVQFLVTELKHSGLLANGFSRLPHYFTAFQGFVVRQAETAGLKFSMPTAMLVLEREARYKADAPTRAGLFVYQFETITRNRLGYKDGLAAMAADPFYDAEWKAFIELIKRQLGVIEFSDLVYAYSELAAAERRRQDPAYQPQRQPLFGEKEGRIAKGSRGREPIYLFAALQRQLGYPEVPKARMRDDVATKIHILETKLRELETRLRLAEGELRGSVDLSQFGKPELLRDDDPPAP